MRKVYLQEEDKEPKATKIIKDLAKSYGDSNEDQGQMVQLLKGLAFSDDPKANELMKKIDKITSDFADSLD